MKTTIEIPQSLNDDGIERLLKKHFNKSLIADDLVEFDFSNTKWCDPFSLSLLTLWILELIDQKVDIRVLTPQSKEIVGFLRNYHFLNVLIKHKIENDFSVGARVVRSLPAQTTSQTRLPTFPLTFFNEPKFNEFLSDLQTPNRLEVVLREMAHADIVKSGAIRDVVLAEIGSNFYVHASGRHAHIIMSTSGTVPDEKKDSRVKKQIQSVPLAQQAFFKALQGEPYLTLVLADMGPGIPTTILKAYKENRQNKANPNPTSIDLLRYAFEYHSTSRSLAERIGSIKDVISNADDFLLPPPPGGLHQLKSMIREFRGMLVARSGGASITEDYLSSSDAPLKSQMTVTNFGGTQYKLFFPFNLPRSKKTFAYKSDNEQKLTCVQLSTTGDIDRPSDDSAIEHVFSEIYQTVESKMIEARKRKGALLIDTKGIDVLQGKYLFYLLIKLMEQEPPSQYTVIVNAPSSLPGILPDTKISSKTFPLLVFDEKWVPRAIGLSEQEETYFEELIGNSATVTNEAKEFAKRFPHWFKYERLEKGAIERYALRLAGDSLKESLRVAYATQLGEALVDSNHEFFSPDHKVLLPSRSYCHGYFDISKFVRNNRFRDMLISWVSYTCERHTPDFIITIGENAAAIVSIDGNDSGQLPQTLNVPTPIRPSRLFQVARDIPLGSRVVVVTDVIGTSESLKSIFRSLKQAEIVATLAVVNATQQGESALLFEDKTYRIEAIVTRRLSFLSSLPNDWDYDDVAQVDPVTHSLISKTTHGEAVDEVDDESEADEASEIDEAVGPCLWGSKYMSIKDDGISFPLLYSNRFLEEALIPSGAVMEGHFVSDSAHMVYLFNIPKLLIAAGNEISELICENANKYLDDIASRPTITQIAYPDYNVGLQELAISISAKFPGSLPVALSRHILKECITSKVELGGAVIFLDDAMYSGSTIFDMLALAEASNVKHVIVYTILRRGQLKLTNRVRKIRRYGRSVVAIREVASVEMPIFKRSDCPVCARSDIFDGINNQLDDASPLRSELNADISACVEIEPQLACREDASWMGGDQNNIAERIRLRWILESAHKSKKFRNQLAEIVRAYSKPQVESGEGKSKEDWRTTLLLFGVLARERTVLLQNKVIREDVFYPTFVDDIAPAAAHFAEQLEKLTHEEAEGVLAVFAAFDPDEFFKRLPHLLNTHREDARLSWLLLRECHLTPEIRMWPQRVLHALSEARQTCVSTGAHIVDDAIKLWEGEIGRRTEGAASLDAFKRLTDPKVHDLTKYIDKLVNDIESHDRSLVADWHKVGEALTIFLGDLSRFRRSLATYSSMEELWSRIQEFEIHFQAAGLIIRNMSGTTTLGLDQSVKASLIKRLVRMKELIDSSIEQPGIRILLENFRCNSQDSFEQVINEYIDQLECGVEWKVTDRAPLVFGESFYIYDALKNIVLNALASGATSLMIHLDIQGDHSVHIGLLDNGRGLEQKTRPHHGLPIIQGIASAYSGSFELRPTCADDPQFYSAYKKLALIILPYIPEKRSIQVR
jgi:adenine/guanine phosphoribosyltransferase-like PRPP-binding protein